MVGHCYSTVTHPHARLQANFWHDWEEGDAFLHHSILGTDNLVWIWWFWEICGAALIRRQGHRSYVRTLKERWSRNSNTSNCYTPAKQATFMVLKKQEGLCVDMCDRWAICEKMVRHLASTPAAPPGPQQNHSIMIHQHDPGSNNAGLTAHN